MFQIILFITFILSSNALLPQFSPIISKLEGIIASKAITTSIFSNIRTEFTVERIFFEISNINLHSFSYLYLSFLITYLYGQYKFNQGINVNKLEKIDEYVKINRIAREFLFIIMFILTKDVQHVS